MTEMTEQKAIEYFDKELKRDCMVLSPMLEGKKSVRAQFFETAISAMEELKLYKENKLCLVPEDVYGKQCTELDEYKQLGTLEEVQEAVERLQPKAPNWHMNPVMEHGKLPVCPTCNTIMVRTEILGRTIDEHCVTCGQAIDWSVSE